MCFVHCCIPAPKIMNEWTHDNMNILLGTLCVWCLCFSFAETTIAFSPQLLKELITPKQIKNYGVGT